MMCDLYLRALDRAAVGNAAEFRRAIRLGKVIDIRQPALGGRSYAGIGDKRLKPGLGTITIVTDSDVRLVCRNGATRLCGIVLFRKEYAVIGKNADVRLAAV